MRTVVTEKEGCVLFPAVTGLQADRWSSHSVPSTPPLEIWKGMKDVPDSR